MPPQHPGTPFLQQVAAYCFVAIDDPHALASLLRRRATDAALLGTVLVAHEGINLFLSGTDVAIDCFIAALHADPRFAGMPVKRSLADAAPFVRLKVKVKVKPEIVSFRHPVAAPARGRAHAVAPARLARWIRDGHDDAGQRLVLLDTRNREEVTHGTFAGAVALPIDRFSDLPAAVADIAPSLAGATVVTFCTGGIRCEKAALWMQSEGIADVMQLDGGILGYFEQVGGHGFDGACFVFDARVALDPSLQPVAPAPPGAPTLQASPPLTA